MAIQPLVFQARWTPANQHLRIYPPTLWGKICRIIWNILSVLIPVLLLARMIGWFVAYQAKRMTLPSVTHYSPRALQEIRDLFQTYCLGPVNNENKRFRESYTVERYAILTPDDARISALYFRYKNQDEQTPTLLYCQPNVALSEQFAWSWLLEKAIERKAPMNFLVPDYRGVSSSDSEGELKRALDLVVDGDSAYQCAREYLHIPQDKLLGYGWSLGGSVLINVKALHPEWNGRCVNERSFSSTADVVKAHLVGLLKLFFFWFPWAMEWTNWNLRTPIHHVAGDVLIVYHLGDATIPYEASCHQQAIRTRFPSLRLTSKTSLRISEIMRFPVSHHAFPLDQYVVISEGNRPADEVIADFVFGPVQQQRMELDFVHLREPNS